MLQTPAAALDVAAAYKQMLYIRRFEERCLALHSTDRIQGSIHPCCGQEAIPVGTAALLKEDDQVMATYRGHGWALACGIPSVEVLAELLGREGGVNGGRGGSAYLADPARGFLGENSIVGAGVPIACGSALAAQRAGSTSVTFVSFGDGATSQGAVHEGMVLAAQQTLPLVLLCENNRWSEMTPIDAVARVPHLAERAAGYGIPSAVVDGDDPRTVAEAVGEAAARARAGEGPTFIELRTHRLLGHYNADVEHYRPPDDRAAAEAADPLPRLRDEIERENLLDEKGLAELEDEVERQLAGVQEAALAMPMADPASAVDEVVAPLERRRPPTRPADDGKVLTYARAVNQALRRELAEHPETLVFGEDVAIPGGVFGVTRELRDEFGPDRVFDTPIAETAILGSAVGAAMRGMRPIAEIMWADFLLVALDQLVNQAANVRYLNRGSVSAPMVVRCQQGAAPGSCAQHSQSLEALLAHIPGLLVGLPSTPQDAYSMLRAAVAHPDPVVIIESRLLYGTKGPVDLETLDPEPFGASKLRSGESLTIVSWGRTAPMSAHAADKMSREGIKADVIDLRWLNPLDFDLVAESVIKTNRVLIVHEANITGGFGAEVAAQIACNNLDDLDAPVQRLGSPDVRFPAAPSMQTALLPQPDSIAEAARTLLAE